MSSPGVSKTSTPMSPLSKDYHRVVSEMETNDLLRSTLTDDSHTQKGDQGNLMRDTPASDGVERDLLS
jgi:hypothetical protein